MFKIGKQKLGMYFSLFLSFFWEEYLYLCPITIGNNSKCQKMSPKGLDLGLQCQTPLKDLKFTVTVVTGPLSFKFSVNKAPQSKNQ